MNNGWDKYQTLVLDKLGSLERFDAEIKAELATMSDRLSNMEKDQVENTANIRYHIKRTDAAEQRIELVEQRLEDEIKDLRTSILSMQQEIRKEMQETRDAVQGWKANLALLGWIFSASTILVGMLLRFYNF